MVDEMVVDCETDHDEMIDETDHINHHHLSIFLHNLQLFC